MTETLRPGVTLEVEEMGYRVTWWCRREDDGRKTTHTAQEVFGTPEGKERALAMVRATPPVCPHGCRPAE